MAAACQFILFFYYWFISSSQYIVFNPQYFFYDQFFFFIYFWPQHTKVLHRSAVATPWATRPDPEWEDRRAIRGDVEALKKKFFL